MKINSGSINALNAYMHAAGSASVKKTNGNKNRKNTDTVEFSLAAKSAAGMNTAASKAKSAASAAANSSASPERIAYLKSAVENGGYFVSSEELASSILEF